MQAAKYPLAVLVAAWVTALLCAPITSVQNLAWLASMSMPVTAAVATEVVVKDVFRFGTTLSILIIGGYAVAFPVAALARWGLRRWRDVGPTLAYGLGGVAAMLAILVLLVETTFQVQLIAGSRTLGGTLAHLVAGFAGGALFAALTTPERKASFAIRVAAAIPLLFVAWAGANWMLTPAQAALGFGLDFEVIGDYGQNTAIRDMTAFFFGNASFVLLGLLTLRYQWFLASAIVFFFAAVFNLVAVHVHGTSSNPALEVEIVLCSWNLLLALSAWVYSRRQEPAKEPPAEQAQE